MRCDGLVAEVADWAAGLEDVHARIAGAVARAEPRARAVGVGRGAGGAAWAAGRGAVRARIGGAVARAEPRAWVLAYLRGLLGQLERKNGWTLAEAAGEVSPDGMQLQRHFPNVPGSSATLAREHAAQKAR